MPFEFPKVRRENTKENTFNRSNSRKLPQALERYGQSHTKAPSKNEDQKKKMFTIVYYSQSVQSVRLIKNHIICRGGGGGVTSYC